MVQHPNAMTTLRIQLRSPPVGIMRESKEPDLVLGEINKGRLMATLPTAPAAFSANAHTISEQERVENDRQRDIMNNPSDDNQSESIMKPAEPIKRIRAVMWSSLSHKKSKVIRAGPSDSPAHSRSFWSDLIVWLLGEKTERTDEKPIRRKPTDEALWSCEQRTKSQNSAYASF